MNSHPSHNLVPFKYYYNIIIISLEEAKMDSGKACLTAKNLVLFMRNLWFYIISLVYFQGLTLLELAAHLEGKWLD